MLRALLSGALAPWRSKAKRSSPGEDADHWLQLAREHASRGAMDEALIAVEHALAADSNDVRVHHLRGVVLAQQGTLAQGRAALARALELAPEDPDILADLGNLCLLSGSEVEASACYARTLRIVPQHTVAALAYARLLEKNGEAAKAADVLRAALGPEFAAPVVRALVTLLDRMGRSGQARELCARILSLAPAHGEAHSGAGFLALKHELDATAAAGHFTRAVESVADDPDLWSNFGIACQELGQLEQAARHYDQALRLAPDHASTHVHRALLRLLSGNYAEGWHEYEHRRSAPDWVDPGYALPDCRESDVRNLTVLVHSEQGIGDEILFASCLPELLAEARAVIVECADKLVPIFARSFPAVQVRPVSDRSNQAFAPRPDAMIAAGSLPGRYRRSQASFAARAPYLVPNPAAVASERERLRLLGSGMKIGLSWRGGTEKTWGPVRSMALTDLLPLLQVPRAIFVNLQYGDVTSELAALRRRNGVSVHHDADALDDYDRTAALAAALDLVVSVDTAIVQLAGAMGCPVWAMVTVSPDWRYGTEGSTMPWYPSVRVFRQARYRDWSDVIASVSAELASLAATWPRGA